MKRRLRRKVPSILKEKGFVAEVNISQLTTSLFFNLKMSEFNDLVDDAENFADEENVDDNYPAEFSSASNNNKRANDDEVQLSSKRVKPPAHLADYFAEIPESRQEKAQNLEEENMKASVNSYAQTNHGGSQSTNENPSFQSKGPNCLCGIGSVSKTTLKEGPNKNRMFWVRPVKTRATVIYS